MGVLTQELLDTPDSAPVDAQMKPVVKTKKVVIQARPTLPPTQPPTFKSDCDGTKLMIETECYDDASGRFKYEELCSAFNAGSPCANALERGSKFTAEECPHPLYPTFFAELNGHCDTAESIVAVVAGVVGALVAMIGGFVVYKCCCKKA